jgi:hypothetical protein
MAPLAHRLLRVSQYFGLGQTSAELDFVDVDVRGDTTVFVSPTAIRMMRSQWADQCVYLIQDFFQEVLDSIRAGKNDHAEKLLRSLREPNETHLGLSSGKPRGRALGTQSAHDVWDALQQSAAVKTGLLKDLEDTVLMIDGIGVDIVSDITTNIIREPLIGYTQEACAYYGIPTESVDSGPLWDPQAKQWSNRFEQLPIVNDTKLLLVPKAIVRRHAVYDADEYLRHYMLEYLKAIEEQNPNSDLVHVLKDGTRRVYKKDLIKRYGFSKKTIVDQSLRHPQVLNQYRTVKEQATPPLTHDEIAGASGTPAPDWDKLLKAVTDLPTGKDHADAYEKAIEGLLTALFYPSLTYPRRQTQIHGGRKRIDITYTNMGNQDFFSWVSQHYTAPYIFVECKNYTNQVGNPELDQLSSRFGPSRGEVGLLVCRKIEDRQKLAESCRDTALDRRGYIIPLDDADLGELVKAAKVGPLVPNDFRLLRDRFDCITT